MKITHKDHSGNNKLPKVPKRPLVLFHWSPKINRHKINHYGLKPGSKGLQGDWKPPYVCFSDDPHTAWQLSGAMWPNIHLWDLWMVVVKWQDSFEHYELITDTYADTGRTYVKEYRVYDRVYKRDLIYIATRSQ